jgi:hypothetical protein
MMLTANREKRSVALVVKNQSPEILMRLRTVPNASAEGPPLAALNHRANSYV